MSANTVYVAYILGCLGLFLLVYSLRMFDLRGVGRVRRRRPATVADEDEFAAPGDAEGPALSRSEAIMIIPRADLAATVTALTIASIALAAVVGFLGPRLIDQLMAPDGVAPLARWTWAAEAPLERVAQITGGLCFAMIALRLLRLLIAITALLVVTVGLYLAVNFILGRPLMGVIGG